MNKVYRSFDDNGAPPIGQLDNTESGKGTETETGTGKGRHRWRSIAYIRAQIGALSERVKRVIVGATLNCEDYYIACHDHFRKPRHYCYIPSL